MGEESLTLKVAEALQDEVGYGRGRLDTVTRNELGLSIGDIVEIHGRRRDPTVAIVWRARTEDEGKGIIRVDGLIRNNAKVNLGDKVEVKKAQVKPAQKVVLAPMMDQSGRVQFGPGIEEVILRGLKKFLRFMLIVANMLICKYLLKLMLIFQFSNPFSRLLKSFTGRGREKYETD